MDIVIVYVTKPVYKILCNRCAELISYDAASFIYTAQQPCIVRSIELIDCHEVSHGWASAFRKSEIISVRVGLGEIKHSYEVLKMDSGQQLQIEVRTYDPRITENTIKLTIENRRYDKFGATA